MTIGSMPDNAETQRVEPELLTGELKALVQFLDYHRGTLVLKCAGLTDDELKRRSIPPSTLSLLGLVRHLTEVEHSWYAKTLDGQPGQPCYSNDTDPDGDFDSLDSVPVEQVWSAYHATVAESRRIQSTFTDGAAVARGTNKRPRNVRWVLIHLVEEYARHNGHADLLRELVDGATGE